VTTTDVWCYQRGNGKSEVDAKYVGAIEVNADGKTGTLARRTPSGQVWDPTPVHKRQRRRTDYRESVSPVTPVPLAASISLPPLHAGEHPLWVPQNPERVLAVVEELRTLWKKPVTDPRGSPETRPTYNLIEVIDDKQPATEVA